MLPYDSVRACPYPRQAILDFLGSVYQVAVDKGGWKADEFVYTAPPLPRRN
jgi:hypothetical protein